MSLNYLKSITKGSSPCDKQLNFVLNALDKREKWALQCEFVFVDLQVFTTFLRSKANLRLLLSFSFL